MSLLVSAHQLSKAFPHGPLFKQISFGVREQERIGLIGPNGAGKSTLLKILAQKESPDSGTLSFKNGLRVAYLAQNPELNMEATVMETALEAALDPHDWESMSNAHELISKLHFDLGGIDENTVVGTLSGGWRKRVALMRELMRSPDLLLLDEPTNHLDVESILWLEQFLANAPFALITITHDRQFLQRVSNKIFELDPRNPDGLLVVDGTYSTYLTVKEQNLSAQERLEMKLKNTLRRETEWLLRGPKARSTKQTARIDRHAELSENVDQVEQLNSKRKVDLQFQGVVGGSKKLVDAKKISKRFGDRVLFEQIDLIITSKTRLGLLGRNGAGKSTLIKTLLGEEPADEGTVEKADHLKVAYFAQTREDLDPQLTVYKSICPQGEYVMFGGKFVHVHGYLERFLFSKDRIQTTVSKLSGGEQSRLLLARLMLMEANLLVLDEPTNDLDLATLHILEEALDEFPGGIILVTHDRMFLDRLCTEIVAFENGKLEHFSDVEQWELWFRGQQLNPAKKKKSQPAPVPSAPEKKTQKLSFKDQRDLDTIELRIAEAESKVQTLANELSTEGAPIAALSQQLSEAQSAVEALYRRWEELLALTK